MANTPMVKEACLTTGLFYWDELFKRVIVYIVLKI